MVAGLAASAGRSLDAHHVTAGGVTLEWHTQNAETLAALRDVQLGFRRLAGAQHPPGAGYAQDARSGSGAAGARSRRLARGP